MPIVLTVSGSPSPESRTLLLARAAGARLRDHGFQVESLDLRDLPPDDLLRARTDALSVRAALEEVARADALIVATPVYKASYTGLLKAFLDLLPQDGLAGKAVLPVATGGTLAHLLVIDYALRPVLAALGAGHVLGGLYAVDQQLVRGAGGALTLALELEARLGRLTDALADAVAQREALVEKRALRDLRAAGA